MDDRGCWEWDAMRDRKGYGILMSGPKRLRAHRISYEIHFGPIPDGLFILHRCDNPPCVNPAHLFLGTLADNNRDKTAKGRHHYTKRATCKRGHPLDGQMKRQRYCRTCDSQFWRPSRGRAA
jgi:hypothetical protein